MGTAADLRVGWKIGFASGKFFLPLTFPNAGLGYKQGHISIGAY